MVRHRRNRTPGATYFFTVTLADRRAPTLTTRIGALRTAFATTRRERPFHIDAIVILPDHLHAIWTLPEHDPDFPARWCRIKSLFTRQACAGVSPWQPRYWEHTIRDEHDLTRHIDYIHFNPVKHGHVANVRDWPHSSFHHHLRAGHYPADWGNTYTPPPTQFGE